MRIRVATAGDAAAIIRVVNAAFSFETFIQGPRTDEIRTGEMLSKGQFLVAEDAGGRIIAAVYAEKRGERGYIGMLAVDPALQGKGLGRTMMEAAEAHCRAQGCTFADIHVLSLRSELLPMYRKRGYVETGTEEFQPPTPLKPGFTCHIIVMSKELESS